MTLPSSWREMTPEQIAKLDAKSKLPRKQPGAAPAAETRALPVAGAVSAAESGHSSGHGPNRVNFTIRGEVIGKPRMTQRDKWKKRPNVERYRAWCDAARLNLPPLPASPHRVDWVAFISIPESWSKKKKAEHSGKRHQSKPDRDNIDKGILDMLFQDDSGISDGTMAKRWDDGHGARIEVTVL